MIYLDHAATAMKGPDQVAEAVAAAMCSTGNSARGAHKASLDASRLIFDTRKKLCQFFHGENPSQIVFTMNATESLNIAIKGVLNPGDHVITTVLEHNSVLRPLYEMERRGVELTILSCDEKGRVDVRDFAGSIRRNTRAIFCTHASNLTGNIIDIQAVGEIAKAYGILFGVDASQTAGVIPIDVKAYGIDILCFTGHKSLLGPQGTGGMYVREGEKVRPLKSGGSGILTYQKEHPAQMPERLEAGTLNGHGIAGLNVALAYLQETGIETIRTFELKLMRQFYEGVRQIKGVTLYGDFETSLRCPIVALNLGDCDSSKVSDELYLEYEIAVRSGGHCAPLMHRALGTEKQGAVRFSFSHYNTAEEVERAIQAVRELASGL